MFQKMIKVIGLALLALTIFTACTDDEDSTTEPTVYESIYVHWMNDSVSVSFENMPTVDLDGEKAILLSSFITDEIVPQDPDSTFFTTVDDTYEARQIYSYQMVGDDGFSASVKGYKNNIWDHMDNGYIMFSSRDVIFPDNPVENFDIAGAYNVKETRHINIFRKFDLICNDSINTFYDLDNMPVVTINNYDGNPEEAIALSSFINKAVEDSVNIDILNNTTLPNFEYNIRSVDNWGPSVNLTWTQFQTGYWLKESKKTIFTDPTLTGGAYKVKYLEKITANE